MAQPFNGVINLDIRDSVSDWSAFRVPNAPEGAPNVLVVLYDEVRVQRRRDHKVVFDVTDDACIDVERHMAAVLARD